MKEFNTLDDFNFTDKTVILRADINCPLNKDDMSLEDDNRIVFRYAEGTNPNGAMNDIAGISNEQGNVIGMMPHPENMIEPLHGNSDCRPLFESLLAA